MNTGRICRIFSLTTLESHLLCARKSSFVRPVSRYYGVNGRMFPLRLESINGNFTAVENFWIVYKNLFNRNLM